LLRELARLEILRLRLLYVRFSGVLFVVKTTTFLFVAYMGKWSQYRREFREEWVDDTLLKGKTESTKKMQT